MTYPYYTSKYTYEPQALYYSKNRYDLDQKPLNNVDFKQSNISQQTIINKAKLYSPDRGQQYGMTKHQVNDKTRTKKLKEGKTHEISQLCQRDQYTQVQEFGGVSGADKQIFGTFQEGDEPHISTPNIGRSGIQRDLGRGTTFGPKYQDNNIIQSKHIQKDQKQAFNRQNIYKKSAIQYLKTDRNFQDINKPYQGTYQTIQQIQKKAMDQIQGLRKDKIQLMKKLNEQIRSHNQQKKLRIQLQNQLSKLKAQLQNKKIHIQSPPQSQLKYQSNTQNVYNQNQRILPPQPQTYNFSNQPTQSTKTSPFLKTQAGTITSQNQILYQKQLSRLQQQNAYLKKNIRQTTTQPTYRENQKQDLRQQITILNDKIILYQHQLQRLKGVKHAPDVYQGHALFQQGQALKSQTLRLINSYNPQPTKQSQFRDHLQKPNDPYQIPSNLRNLKPKLTQLQNERDTRLGQGNKKYLQSQLSGISHLPINNRISRQSINAPTYNDNYLKEFEQII